MLKKNFITILAIITISYLISDLWAQTKDVPAESYPVNNILTLNVSSSINPATLNYLRAGYKKAEEENYEIVVIKLNTPGGLVTTTKEILTLFGSSDIPTVVWVTPEGASATSAGAIIASGAHILLMSQGTNIGAATPIQMQGDIKQTDLKKKAVNDLVALIQSLSETRGRNGRFFGKMVEEAASYKAAEAKAKGLIDDIANTNADIIKILSGRTIFVKGKKLTLSVTTPQFVPFEMDLGQKLLNIFANPSMAYILFIIGAALIYLELQAPGGFIAGSIGTLCLILAGIGFQILPLNFGALGLMILSFVLFILEAYITSYGILSLAGLAALITGSLFLFRTDNAYIELSRGLIFSASSAIALFLLLVGYLVVKDFTKKKKFLFFSLVGRAATVTDQLSSDEENVYIYQVKISGEIWNARSDKKYEVGDKCKILGQDKTNMKLKI